jgi:hypothetical protein
MVLINRTSKNWKRVVVTSPPTDHFRTAAQKLSVPVDAKRRKLVVIPYQATVSTLGKGHSFIPIMGTEDALTFSPSRLTNERNKRRGLMPASFRRAGQQE